jgi:hypothetical protein
MAIQVIVNQIGPLPITETFEAPSDAPMYLEVNGSVWSQETDITTGIAIFLDGEQIGRALIFSNGNATHRAVVPAYVQVQLGEGQHTLKLDLDSGATVSDYNDLYTAVLHY